MLRNTLGMSMRIPRVNGVRPERVIWNTKRKGAFGCISILNMEASEPS